MPIRALLGKWRGRAEFIWSISVILGILLSLEVARNAFESVSKSRSAELSCQFTGLKSAWHS